MSALGAFTDAIMVRDPRAWRRPHGRFAQGPDGSPHLMIDDGPVTLKTAFCVRKADGAAFAEVTGDDNPIHREGNIVPGALTVARTVLPLEILLPEMSIVSLEATFSAIALYDQRTVVCGRLAADENDGGLRFEGRVTQGYRDVAKVTAGLVLTGSAAENAENPKLKKQVRRELARVRSFLRACRVRPLAYFRRQGAMDLSYPTAFLAALPSGELVRSFDGGAGGLLNRLSLQFEPGQKVALASREVPEANVEVPSKLRKTFNRIATRIRAGLTTLGRGNALVLTAEGAKRAGAEA